MYEQICILKKRAIVILFLEFYTVGVRVKLTKRITVICNYYWSKNYTAVDRLVLHDKIVYIGYSSAFVILEEFHATKLIFKSNAIIKL